MRELRPGVGAGSDLGHGVGVLLAPKPNPAGFVYLPLFIPRKANFPGVWGHPQTRHIK